MQRILLVCLAAAACHKEAAQSGPAPHPLTEAPPPPAIQIAQSLKENDEQGFRVVAGRPRGKLVGMARPTITFSEPVVALATPEQQDPASQLPIEPPLKGQRHRPRPAAVEVGNWGPPPYPSA